MRGLHWGFLAVPGVLTVSAPLLIGVRHQREIQHEQAVERVLDAACAHWMEHGQAPESLVEVDGVTASDREQVGELASPILSERTVPCLWEVVDEQELSIRLWCLEADCSVSVEMLRGG